jgi:hypothetical protein
MKSVQENPTLRQEEKSIFREISYKSFGLLTGFRLHESRVSRLDREIGDYISETPYSTIFSSTYHGSLKDRILLLMGATNVEVFDNNKNEYIAISESLSDDDILSGRYDFLCQDREKGSFRSADINIHFYATCLLEPNVITPDYAARMTSLSLTVNLGYDLNRHLPLYQYAGLTEDVIAKALLNMRTKALEHYIDDVHTRFISPITSGLTESHTGEKKTLSPFEKINASEYVLDIALENTLLKKAAFDSKEAIDDLFDPVIKQLLRLNDLLIKFKIFISDNEISDSQCSQLNSVYIAGKPPHLAIMYLQQKLNERLNTYSAFLMKEAEDMNPEKRESLFSHLLSKIDRMGMDNIQQVEDLGEDALYRLSRGVENLKRPQGLTMTASNLLEIVNASLFFVDPKDGAVQIKGTGLLADYLLDKAVPPALQWATPQVFNRIALLRKGLLPSSFDSRATLLQNLTLLAERKSASVIHVIPPRRAANTYTDEKALMTHEAYKQFEEQVGHFDFKVPVFKSVLGVALAIQQLNIKHTPSSYRDGFSKASISISGHMGLGHESLDKSEVNRYLESLGSFFETLNHHEYVKRQLTSKEPDKSLMTDWLMNISTTFNQNTAQKLLKEIPKLIESNPELKESFNQSLWYCLYEVNKASKMASFMVFPRSLKNVLNPHKGEMDADYWNAPAWEGGCPRIDTLERIINETSGNASESALKHAQKLLESETVKIMKAAEREQRMNSHDQNPFFDETNTL